MSVGTVFKILLGILAALTLIPVGTGGLNHSQSNPITTYDSAVTRFEAISAVEAPITGEPGRSVLLTHGKKTGQVVVLMHGMTNVPRQFVPLGTELFDCGYNVYIPRLPLHGLKSLDVSVLKKLRPQMYRAYADSAIDLARGLGDTISVVGLSAGGSAAAWVAEHRRDVYRAVVIAPAITLERIPPVLRGPAINLLTRIPNMTFHQPPDTARFVYRGVSTKGVAQTLRFGKAVYQEADRNKPQVPRIVMVTNENDHTIDSHVARQLANRWRYKGAMVDEFKFDKKLGLQHDVIDTMEVNANPKIVYPVVINLLEGTVPTIVGDSAVLPPPRCSGSQ